MTAKDLIARLTPTALAEVIASIEISDNLDRDERETRDYARSALIANVGTTEADELMAAAR